jgi:hypothetical protein
LKIGGAYKVLGLGAAIGFNVAEDVLDSTRNDATLGSNFVALGGGLKRLLERLGWSGSDREKMRFG